ncbi:hypothetical protein WJX82_005498 [Trebouxia sp. C0006]
MRHSFLVNSSAYQPSVSISKQWEANGSRRGRQQKIAAFGLSTRQRPIVSMSRSVQEQLDRLMRTAARRQEAPARRTASVRSMHSLLRTPQGQAAGQAMLPILWPAVLQLLQDIQVDMRQTVAPVVGFLGALAARPGRPAGVSPNLLFEWAMPVLSGQGIGVWTHLDMSVKCWVLVALKEGLAAVEVPVLHQHALAVLTLCHSLLRSEGTSVHLIAPVSGLVSEASRHLPSLRTMFRGLVDLLVAWWLEPRLDDIVRPLLARTLDSLKQGWQHDPALGKALLTRLLQDLQAVTSAKSAVSAEGVKRFMRLCSCMEAIVSGCGPRIGVDLPELLGQWISGMHKGYDKFYALPKRPAAQTSSALEQLCTYIQHAITAALSQHTQTMTPLQQNTPSTRTKCKSTQQGQVASGPVQVDTPSQSSPAVQSASVHMQTLASPILDFVSAAASSEAVQASALLHLLKLAQSLVDAMQQQQCEAASKQVEVLMDADSAIGKLRRHSESQAVEPHDQLVDISSGVAALDRAVAAHQDGDVCGEIWKQLVHLAGPSGPLEANPDWLGQTAPLVVSQPGSLNGSTADDKWLWSMLKSCQTTGPSVTFPLTSGAAAWPMALASAAVAFYKSNRKVCEDWFTRMRMLLLRTSAASNSPHLTLHHAFARLADLKAQLRHLQAAAAEAEAARAAEAAAARPSHGRGSHRASAKQAPSPVSDAPAQRGQSRVLQVKRLKPGQVTSVQPTPKVLPLTKAPSGKVVVATPAPTPGKIKLMARPQSAAEGAAATLQSGSEGRADSTSKQHLNPSHARMARAQAARRDGMERLSSDSSKSGADGQQFGWLHGVTLQASARHEEAAVIYTRCLQQHDKADTCGPEGQAFLVDRCCEAYASVADWEGLQQWLQDLKGQKQVSNGRDTSHWPLAPAQEHNYDALAAFDAGQLQEAQHAFDLSVWSDLKGDKGGVHAAEAAEATSLKALMQLHAHSSAKQRPGRDKRLIRTLLQDSKDTLLQSLSELLQRLEQLDPAAVLYPALVESKRISKGQATAKPGLQALLDSCQARQPQLVEQMATMMTELEHMSVLWIEQWHIALLELQAEVGKRVASLQEELKRVTAQAGLDMSQQLQIMRDRYTTILAPAMHMIQQRLSLNTADDAQTPQQEHFFSKHLPALKQAAAAFAHPSDDVLMHPELAWNTFKAVSRAIAQQLSAREVQLTALSPVLSDLAATLIPIPGLTPAHPLPPTHPQYPSGRPIPSSGSVQPPEPGISAAEPYQISSADVVTVASFKPSVHVMSTKTRPKRIAMLGSDGRTYTFLLKGWEDLRLDERLMQLVRTFSGTLRSDPDTARRQLLPCPLSVTPLGASMGLIQWVDHTMPLYGVYKAWQHRQLTDKAELAKAQAAAAGQPSGTAVAIHPSRATDAFYAKLLPALEAAGLSRTTPRKDWPLPLLKQILTESVQETPGHLLARELWCGCGSASEWWAYQAGYTSSTAAMSMVGHLLGLGDRHLDNILLDKHTGRVVHIDYNIVFDKGQQLRVPEIVPFRLTHTLQAALGATGVEGAFRRGCEHIIRVARRHSTTLSSLLQSVLVDPLVTWLPDRDQAGTKKDADAAVALNLFFARSTEQKASCSEVLSLAAALPGAAAALQAYAAVHTVADQTASTARAAHREVLEAQEAQAAAASSTEAITIGLHQAHASIPQLVKELHSNRQLLQRHLRECQGWADRHQYTVKALRDQIPAELMYPNSHWAADQAPVQLGLVSSLGASSIPSIVQAALQCSQRQITLPPMLLHQAHSIDQQASQLLAQRGQGILAGLAGLQAYSAALRLVLMPDYSDSSHHSQWARAVDSAIVSSQTEAMLESMQLAPHPSNPQDIIVTWHALKALPTELASACQRLDHQLTQIHLNRQPMLRSVADAKTELMGCLDEVLDGAKADSLVAGSVRACLLAVGDEAQSADGKSAAFNTTHCIQGLSQLAILLKDQPEAVSCLQWVAPFSKVTEMQLALQWQFASEVLPYLNMYSTCGFGPSESQHVGLIEVLHAEIADTEAAIAQLQQESLGHADLLASFPDQMTVLQRVAAALSAVQLSSESWETNEQLVAFEWVHEAELEAALQPMGGLGQPALIAPKDPLSEPNWSLSIRRSQVVNALESALCILSDAEEAWLAWRHASSQTETQLRRLFRSGQQQHNVHEQFLTSRQQWLSGCDDIAGWIERMAQNVLQLERSREGVVWSRSAGADDKPFAECGALLQQRQFTCSALQNAEQEVKVAQQTLPELREQAAAAAAKLQPAQVQERQLGQSFAQQAPRLLQVAQAVVQPVRDCQKAAREAPSAVEQTQAALEEVLGHLEGSSSAKAIRVSMQEALDQLTSFQQHAPALAESLSGVIEAVEYNLHADSQQQPPQSLMGKPSKGFSKSKRAALVLDAMTPLLPAAMDQVQLPDLTDLSVKQLASAVAALPEQAKAVATSIQQAYQAQAAETSVTLPLASEVADAQPSASGVSVAVPQAAFGVVGAGSHQSGSNSDLQDHSGSESDSAALVGTAGDDLEQDTKAILKAGGQDGMLKDAMRSGLQQTEDSESQKARRTAFASATLGVFQDKLFGKASLEHRSLDVEQHVDQLIKQATSPDNLCQMYEGWTAWI